VMPLTPPFIARGSKRHDGNAEPELHQGLEEDPDHECSRGRIHLEVDEELGEPTAAFVSVEVADAAGADGSRGFDGAEIHAARLMVLHAAWRIENEGASAARQEISLIKFTVARTLQRVLDRALQTLGGLGMTDDTPLAFWYAHERAARIYDGADEVHIESVARRILRKYGMPR